MKIIRVLMVLASTNVGGAEMFVLNLLRNMDLKRFQVDIVVSLKEKNNGIGNELKRLGCRIYSLPFYKGYNYLQYRKAWKEFFINNHYDIVHGHVTNSAGIYLHIAKSMGCATIAHCHSAGYRGNWFERIVKYYLSRKARNVADYWFACSEKAAEHLFGKTFYTYGNYYTIPNAINTDKYLYNENCAMKVRKEYGVAKDTLLCGHVGSFTAPKNHLFLIDIFYKILQRNPNSKLLCCGEGDLMSRFKEKAEQLGIADKLILPGIVKNVNECLMSMDVFIFPSLFEGFPLSVVEAEATGLPVVMSDTITKEIDLLDSVERCSIKDDPAIWAERVCKLRRNERQACNQMISNSKYNMSVAAKMVMSLYDKMVQEKENGI